MIVFFYLIPFSFSFFFSLFGSRVGVRVTSWSHCHTSVTSDNMVIEKDIEGSKRMISIISQTLKHVQDMFDFNTTSKLHSYLVLFVSKTPSVVWYFIMDLILPKFYGYFTLFESKSTVIFICIHCLITSFKLCKFTQTLHSVFPSPNLNSYVVFY